MHKYHILVIQQYQRHQGWVLAGTSRYNYIMIHCDTMNIANIAIFHIVHKKLQNRADKQVAVHNLGRLNTSHYITNSVDKLSRNSLIKNVLFTLFERYRQITNTLV